MTFALRAHRLLCRLGLHLPGRWHVRKKKSGEYRVCASCKRDRWRPDSERVDETFVPGPRFEEAYKYPVDRFNFPVIDHAPRDGVTHEG